MASEYRITTPSGELTVRPAEPADVPAVVDLYDEGDRWQRARGIDPGRAPRPLDVIAADRVSRGEIYLAWRGGVAVGTLTLLWADEDIWADRPGSAAYVHGLMVRRANAGEQIGLALLSWAAEMAAADGKAFLRLDCQADNPALRAYYERAGFTHRGDVTLPSRRLSRYERPM